MQSKSRAIYVIFFACMHYIERFRMFASLCSLKGLNFSSLFKFSFYFYSVLCEVLLLGQFSVPVLVN